MPAPFALSLQDLAPIAAGTSTADAMAETVKLAQEAEAKVVHALGIEAGEDPLEEEAIHAPRLAHRG